MGWSRWAPVSLTAIAALGSEQQKPAPMAHGVVGRIGNLFKNEAIRLTRLDAVGNQHKVRVLPRTTRTAPTPNMVLYPN